MVRFGILGFGLHAVRRLMPGFALAKRSRVSALSRRNMEAARESARQYEIPLAFDSAENLCRSPEVDAVFVTTPNALHLQDVLLAISYGKPVLCEKPMAMNAQECRQMVEAAHTAKVLLGIAQVFRFEDSTARLRERIASGQVGKVVFARSEFCFPGRGHARTWITDPELSGGGPIGDRHPGAGHAAAGRGHRSALAGGLRFSELGRISSGHRGKNCPGPPVVNASRP